MKCIFDPFFSELVNQELKNSKMKDQIYLKCFIKKG